MEPSSSVRLPIMPEAFSDLAFERCPVCDGTGRYSEHSRRQNPGLTDDFLGELDGTCEGSGVRVRMPRGLEAVLALLAINAYTSSGIFRSSGASMSQFDDLVVELHRVIGTY